MEINGIEGIKTFLTSLSLTLPRIGGLFALLPFMGTQVIPGMVRMCLAMSLALLALPSVYHGLLQMPVTIEQILPLVMKEIFIGLLMSFFCASLFWAAGSLGFFLDNQRGATISSSLNPMTGVEDSPISTLMGQAMIALFVTAGGFDILAGIIFKSYALWPVLAFWPSLQISGTSAFLQQMDAVMKFAVVLAAPVVLAMTLAELGLAFINRFAQQLQVFYLAMPVKSAICMLVLALYTPFLVDYIFREIDLLRRVPLVIAPLMR
ncbi:MAG: type III secretion system export apparatus subunit SctT [Parvibaculaceae bacterium]|nr:type III secretion system export apparatus subunit SctT [Parvibaculaceae bacterium]